MKNRLGIVLTLVLLTGCLFTACSNNNDGASKITSSPISLTTASGTLYGVLELPASQAPVAVLLIIAGSGPTDRDGNSTLIPGKNDSLKMLAEALAENGFASVRYDKRGIGESQAAGLDERDLRFDDYVNDAVAWVELLRADARFSQVGIVGHSEGSLIGMLAAAQSGADVFVSLAGAGRPAHELIMEQLAGQPEAVIQEVERINAELLAGNVVADADPTLYSLFRPSVQPYLISWYRYDPTVEIAKLTCPVLLVQGSTDLQVKPADAELLKAAWPAATYALIEGMNHVLKDAPLEQAKNIAAYGNPDLPLNKDLVNTLVAFLKDALK